MKMNEKNMIEVIDFVATHKHNVYVGELCTTGMNE